MALYLSCAVELCAMYTTGQPLFDERSIQIWLNRRLYFSSDCKYKERAVAKRKEKRSVSAGGSKNVAENEYHVAHK